MAASAVSYVSREGETPVAVISSNVRATAGPPARAAAQ